MQKLKDLMDYLHTLSNIEALLDDEIDRLESEFNWDMKRCVYLQALECDAFHLDRLDFKMNRNQNLIQVYRKLLRIAFKEKTTLINVLQKQHTSGNKEQAEKGKSEWKETRCPEPPVVKCLDSKPQNMKQESVSVFCTNQQPYYTTVLSLPELSLPASVLNQPPCCSVKQTRPERFSSKSHLAWSSDLTKFRRKTCSKCLPFKLKPKKRKIISFRTLNLSLKTRMFQDLLLVNALF